MTADATTPDPLAALIARVDERIAEVDVPDPDDLIALVEDSAWDDLALLRDIRAALARGAGSDEPLHEVCCPACGATIRARLADVESGDSGLDPAIEKARARGRARGQQVVPNDHPDILAAHLDNALARERWAAQDHAYAAAQVGALRERIATLAPSAGSDTTTETED